MPLYAYKCDSCEHEFEARQRFSDEPLTVCPVCGNGIRRLITPVGVVFKGSGFYVTDNRNGKGNSYLGSGRDGKEKDSATSTETTKTSSESKADAASRPDTANSRGAANTSTS